MRKRTKLNLGALAAATLALHATPATAQQDPTELGGAKKPYVLMIIDSSASMEYTTVGDNKFATTDLNGDGNYDLNPAWSNTTAAAAWEPGIEMAADANQGFGSCWIYHPESGCGDYRRPSWRNNPPFGSGLPSPPSTWLPGNPSNSGAVSQIRGTDGYAFLCAIGFSSYCAQAGWRLQNPTQPRHVTIKEILTGNMILMPNATSGDANDFDKDLYGPGCWFIPRQRDASTQTADDQNYCDGVPEFERIPDFDQPLPHFQEFYDLQQPTGVMDRLAGTALFAVAAFDSYRDDQDWSGYNKEINDRMEGSSPSWSSLRADTDEDSNDCYPDNDDNNEPCYNLGIWRVIGPKDLSVPASMIPELAAYTQIAVNDTGFLRSKESSGWKDNDYTLFTDDKKNGKENGYLGVRFSKNFKKYASDVDLGRQPIARATPIAAAIHDVYQFMAHGQKDEDPINDDDFRSCRPKHVVMLTDGKPEPERGPTGESDTLNEAFGYDIGRYKYEIAEAEINALVDDADDSVYPDNSADAEDLNKYNVRVHVVGLNVANGSDTEAIGKMAQMAISGNSCASALVPHLVPAGYNYDAGNGDIVAGTCPVGSGCLVPQGSEISADYSGYTWMHPATEDVYACDEFPALILDNNDPEVLSAAIFSFISALVDTSGLTTRTRAVVANRLDDLTIGGGGQYRIYSGVRVGGGSPWWKGVINRTTLFCDGSDPAEVSLDQEVGYQVDLGTGAAPPSDSRRVWTAMPDENRWCYDCATTGPRDLTYGGVPNSLYPMQYNLMGAYDEFGATYLAGATASEVVGTRVPFRYGAIEDSMAVDPWAEFNTSNKDELEEVVNVFRGRTPLRVSTARGGELTDLNGAPHDRTIGGILNSNPVVVGPPQLDLPIASYRAFRSRFAERPTMLYVSSMDGTLHAIHTGKLEDAVRVRQMTPEGSVTPTDVDGDAAAQREAWAYVPWMVHKELSSYTTSQAYLVDGTPVVKDVRLCNQSSTENTNIQACKNLCASGTCTTTGAEQWRTVLVQGRGEAGIGYYAMDVTRPGGKTVDYGSGSSIEAPDPILLWEFDDDWEEAQIKYIIDAGEKLRVLSNQASSQPDNDFLTGCADTDEFWFSSLMGRSISEPAIGTVIVKGQQRPVAIFGGGGSLPDSTECGAAAAGMSIYVIDLQTGSLLRRFTHYVDDSGNEVSFMNDSTPHRFSGSPALYDSATGSIATRGFIGDEEGRMFRIDLLDPDPEDWEISMFFDPREESVGGWDNADWGPGAFKPTVALNAARDVVVVYGTGEVGDLVNTDKKEAVFAVVEDRSDFQHGILTWAQEFEDYEKLTGAPIIFNGDVYFPTYKLPSDDQCDPGTARIWGLRLTDSDPDTFESVGIFAGNPAVVNADPSELNIDMVDYKWFGPVEPTLIRGLTVTLGEICSTDNIGDPADQTFNPGAAPQPQLLAQTSSPVANEFTNTDSAAAAAANALDRMVTPINRPESQTLPLSWSLLY